MELVESINLINNSIISAIDKLHPESGDLLTFYLRTDENGDIKVPFDEVQHCAEFIQKFLNQNYNNVKFMIIPDGIRYDNGDTRDE